MGDLLLRVLVVLGAGLALLGMVMFVQTRRFVRRCLRCDGRVLRYADDLDGDPTFPVVAFEDGFGHTYEITRPSTNPLPEIGTIVPVAYFPSDPSNAWAAGTVTPWVIPGLVTLAGLALILTALIMALV